MEYQIEKNKLLSLLDKEVWTLFAEKGAIVAGGAITSLFCNRDINDIDVYFRSEKDLVHVLSAIYNKDDIYVSEAGGELNSFQVHVNGLSQRTIVCTNKDQLVQLMTFKYFPEIKDIFETFDYTVCMGAYDCKSGEFILHPEFMKHNSQRILMFNKGTAYPLMSLLRVEKYKEKGYNISKAELLKVLFACMDTKITSWEEAKEHIGGMYGYDMSKAFIESNEFSLQELIDQLGTIQHRNVPLYTQVQPISDFNEVCMKLFYKPEDKSCILDHSKYLYKSTKGDWTSYFSHYNTNKVNYELDAIIEVPKGGLWFYPRCEPPYVHSKYWIECEPIDCEYDESSSELHVTSGKVKVIRQFIRDKDHIIDWMIKTYSDYEQED